MPLRGDTIRFEVRFRGYDGEELRYEPSTVTFRIYDKKEDKIMEQELNERHKLEDFYYFYDFTIPMEYEGIYHYEFEGIFRNKPFVARDDFNVTF